MIHHFAVKAYGPDQSKLRVALYYGTLLAREHRCQLTLLMPTLKAADGTILSKVLNETFVRNLAKGQVLRLEECLVSMKSMQTVNPFQERGIVLGLWGGEKMLKKLDGCLSAKAVIALSWIPEEIEEWSIRHSAKAIDAPPAKTPG